jgi:CubicO group peptidase (beta-lactamase class C family)
MIELPKTRAVLEQGITQGLHTGAQVYVSRDRETLADFALGESRPGVAMTTDSITLWMSSVKPISAVAIAQLVDRGVISYDDPIAVHFPEFATKGKDDITIRQVLTHTSPLRGVNVSRRDSFDAAIQKLIDARPEPNWKPGERAGYHPIASWYLLAEIVHRRDGRPFEQYVREAIFLPVGMRDSWIGMPPDAYRAYGDRIALMTNTSGTIVSAAPGDSEADAAIVRPSGNGRGPIRELGKFYEMLLAKRLHGDNALPADIVSAEQVRLITSRQRVGMLDETFKQTIDWGLGFLINSKPYGELPYNYGDHASPDTFGHSGSQSSCAFADPDNKLVVAWLCNGMPGEAKHQARQTALNNAIYQDLEPQMNTDKHR